MTSLQWIQPSQADIVAVPNTFTAGQILPAASLNTNFTAIFNNVNGNLINTNIKAGAGILSSKLNFSSTAFAASMSCAASAARAFVLPDVSGTVVLTTTATFPKMVISAKSSAFNATGTSGTFYECDASGGDIVASLPASPGDGTMLLFECTSAAHNVLLTPNGAEFVRYAGITYSPLTLTKSGYPGGALQFVAVPSGWVGLGP